MYCVTNLEELNIMGALGLTTYIHRFYLDIIPCDASQSKKNRNNDDQEVVECSGDFEETLKYLGQPQLSMYYNAKKLDMHSYGQNVMIKVADFEHLAFEPEKPSFVKIELEKNNMRDNSKWVHMGNLDEYEFTTLHVTKK